MPKLKIWMTTLLSTILVIVGLLTLAWYRVSGSWFGGYWTWSYLIETNFVETAFVFYDNPKYLIPGMIVTVLQLISLIMLIILTIQLKKETISAKKAMIMSLVPAILLLFSSIAFIVGAGILVEGWIQTYSVGPGLILPMISGIISIITAILAKKRLD